MIIAEDVAEMHMDRDLLDSFQFSNVCVVAPITSYGSSSEHAVINASMSKGILHQRFPYQGGI